MNSPGPQDSFSTQHPSQRAVAPRFTQAMARPVTKRVDLALDLIGMPRPPAAVHLDVSGPTDPRAEDAWKITARMFPGQAESVVQWFSQWDPVEHELGRGVAPKQVDVTFDGLEGPWKRILYDRCVETLVFTPEGTASLVVKGRPVQVQRFIDGLRKEFGEEELRVRPHYGETNLSRVELTKRQTEVISLAVALGYYEVPRRLDLRTLAKRLNLSLGATSELMRRGEATIISSYIDSLMTNGSR